MASFQKTAIMLASYVGIEKSFSLGHDRFPSLVWQQILEKGINSLMVILCMNVDVLAVAFVVELKPIFWNPTFAATVMLANKTLPPWPHTSDTSPLYWGSANFGLIHTVQGVKCWPFTWWIGSDGSSSRGIIVIVIIYTFNWRNNLFKFISMRSISLCSTHIMVNVLQLGY